MKYDFKDLMAFGMFILALLTYIYLGGSSRPAIKAAALSGA